MESPEGCGFCWVPAVTLAPGMVSDALWPLSKYEGCVCEETKLEKAGEAYKTQNGEGGDVERAGGRGPRSQEAGDPA